MVNADTSTFANQRRNNHNRVARHEARQRAVQSSNAQGTAYRESQAAAAMANTVDRADLDESKEHWTGRNDTMLDPGMWKTLTCLFIIS